MPDKAPAFQFYPKDFLTDEKVVRMSNTEVGIYIRLLSYCWLEGTLPLETENLAHMARMPVKQFTKLWENSTVKTCFQVGDDGRLHHKRLDEERDKQAHFRRRASDGGKAALGRRGANGRFETRVAGAASTRVAGASHTHQAPGSTSSPISDLQSPVSNLQTAVDRGGGSKRPIYQSDRFVVFEWQLDELARTLGPHLDAFDLHGFFDDLSRQSREDGLVIPSDREARWKWLQAQVEGEVRRRGLPMADVATVPTNKRVTGLMTGGQAFLNRRQA